MYPLIPTLTCSLSHSLFSSSSSSFSFLSKRANWTLATAAGACRTREQPMSSICSTICRRASTLSSANLARMPAHVLPGGIVPSPLCRVIQYLLPLFHHLLFFFLFVCNCLARRSIDPFGHSSQYAKLNALFGFDFFVVGRVDFQVFIQEEENEENTRTFTHDLRPPPPISLSLNVTGKGAALRDQDHGNCLAARRHRSKHPDACARPHSVLRIPAWL